MRKLALNDEILLKIEKPARYIGGEYNLRHERPGKGRCQVRYVFSGRLRNWNVPSGHSDPVWHAQLAGTMSGVRESILPGWIWMPGHA